MEAQARFILTLGVVDPVELLLEIVGDTNQRKMLSPQLDLRTLPVCQGVFPCLEDEFVFLELQLRASTFDSLARSDADLVHGEVGGPQNMVLVCNDGSGREILVDQCPVVLGAIDGHRLDVSPVRHLLEVARQDCRRVLRQEFNPCPILDVGDDPPPAAGDLDLIDSEIGW